MAILTGDVIKDKVKVVVKLKLFWIRKISARSRINQDQIKNKSRSAIKRAAIEQNASTNNIIAANIAGVTDNVLAKLPRMETMRRDVRRQRATHAAYSPILDDSDT